MAVSYTGLDPRLRNLVRNLPAFARATGLRYRVTSAYRSPAKQARLYREYLAGLSPYPVAPPGTSLHETGQAIDIVSDDQNRLAAILTSAGLSWGGAADPVHFSIAGRKSKTTAFSAYAEEVGSVIPYAATQLPLGFGKVFSVLKDPWGTAKFEANKFIDIIFGLI